MQQPLVGVVLSNRTDFNVMRRGLETLRVMGVPYVFEVMSANRTPERVTEFARTAGSQGIEVILAASSNNGAIFPLLAANTNLPIIGVPIDASALRGQDSLFAMSMMPPGLPVAVVGINNAENGALLATQILALKHVELRRVLAHRRMNSAQRIDTLARDLAKEYPDLCERERTTPPTPDAASGDTDPGITPATEANTPPTDKEVRIQPGATSLGDSRPAAQSLVSTPVPQEPGSSQEVPRLTQSTLRSPLSNPVAPLAMPQQPPGNTAEWEDEEEITPPLRGKARAALQTPATGHAESEEDETAAVEREALERSDENPGIETKIFKIDRDAELNQDLIDHVMMVLLEGGIVGIPTDTVYGLAADATNKAAIGRLSNLKGREHQKTLGVLIHSAEILSQLARSVPDSLEPVLEECWPGALTVVLAKQPGMLSSVTRSDRIGVRVPSDPVCLSIISRIGRPIAMRNASLGAEHPMTSPDEVIEYYTGHIDCILDAGECPNSLGPSTVLSAIREPFEILREGAVSRDRLKNLLGGQLKD